MATLFWPKQTLSKSFSYLKPVNIAKFLWPIGDWINRVPLYWVEEDIYYSFTNLSSHDRKFMSRLWRLVNVALSRGTSNVELNISGTPMPTKNIGTFSSSPFSETLIFIFMQPVQWTTLKNKSKLQLSLLLPLHTSVNLLSQKEGTCDHSIWS